VQLGRATGDPVKFLNRQFKRAIVLRATAEQEVKRPISRIVWTVPLPKVLLSPRSRPGRNPGARRRKSRLAEALCRLVKTTSGPS
jgi:hypothetical protein